MDNEDLRKHEEYSQVLTEFFERMSSWENSIVASSEVSLPQMHLLEIVGNCIRPRMKEVAEKLGVTTGTLTVMVHRLIEKGYLNKKRDAEDKRSYFLELTDKGHKEYAHHHYMHNLLIEDMLSLFGEKDAETFFSKLKTAQSLL